MADHRKSFRPRRLAFDGRLLSRGCLLGATLALLCALSPAQAQNAGLKNGAASLNSGSYNAAVRQLSAAVNDRNTSKGQAAKALYLRGVAYRKLNQQGRAISDLGAAIWLGLPQSDKVKALVNKGMAFKAAGLSSQGDAELARARSASSSATVQRLISEDGGAGAATADSVEISSSRQSGSSESIWTRWIPDFGGEATPRPKPGAATPPPAAAPPAAAPKPSSTRTAAAAPTSGWDASVSDGAPKKSSSGVGRWFGSIAGDSSASAPIAAAPSSATTAAPKSTTAPKATVAPPTAASWAANTETQKVASKSSGGGIGRWFGGSSSSKSSAPTPAAVPAGGGYRVQLANSRSQADAKALWKQVQGKNPQLASVQPQIEKVDIGSFGTFYSLKVGPYASQSQSTKVCNALKRSGTDCSVVSPDGP